MKKQSFKTCPLPRKTSIDKGFRLLGFSIAEAMVTLLIVSIALAAAAPIMSRKMKSDIDNAARSKWSFTRNRQDITRESGNVGIGVSTSQNPQAKLDIRVSDTDDAIRIYKNNSLVVTITNNGTLLLNTPNNTNRRMISIQQNGTENAWINSDGSSSFTSVIPRGAVMLFDRNSYGYTNGCPTGWTNISAGQTGRFLMLGTNANVGVLGNASLPDHWHGVAAFDQEANNDIRVLMRNYSVTNSRTQGHMFRWVDGDGGGPKTKAINDATTANYTRTWGFGTTSYLYPASANAVSSTTISTPTNNFDVRPQSISVIACRFDG